ncbi:MAG: hypothetical protein DMG49_00260 [Acidobacteria bacterium]|nr:MAG: hypothetical protein DMG49_00260 [Acidobacteriota bacterium]
MKTLTLLIGYAAVAVGTTFMLPQILKSWKTKRVDDLSLASVTLYFANSIVANARALVISICQVFLKLKYRVKPTPAAQIEHAAEHGCPILNAHGPSTNDRLEQRAE